MKKVINNQVFFETIKETLNENHSVSFVVKGTSMLPFFKDGITEVFLEKKHRYRKHDICLFTIEDKYLMHRLIKVNKDIYIFRGDHLYTKEKINKENIVATVYQFKNYDKIVNVNHLFYRSKVFVYLILKRFKIILRSIYKSLIHKPNHRLF